VVIQEEVWTYLNTSLVEEEEAEEVEGPISKVGSVSLK